MSMFIAAGTFGSPGIVIMEPVSTTMKPAPFDTLNSFIVISKSFGLPNKLFLSDNEYCVFAIHTGKLL